MPAEAELSHQRFEALRRRFVVLDRHLDLEEAAQSINIIEVDPSGVQEKQRPPLSDDAPDAERELEYLTQRLRLAR